MVSKSTLSASEAASLKAQYDRDGYAVARGVFAPDEVKALIEYFMELRTKGSYEGDFSGDGAKDTDPLKKFPRMLNMHRWDQVTRNWLLDSRLFERLNLLLGVEAYAAQSMIYFKPAGARGQALHQDNYYLQASPGTCMAAWMALDPCEEENGCMMVVPGSHKWPVMCVKKANLTESFTKQTVPLPPGAKAVPVIMQPGDVLFFNGTVVHGSMPNRTTDRFRRSLIGHYIESTCDKLVKYDQPLIRESGEELFIDAPADGGPCGEWVDVDGTPVIEMNGRQPATIEVDA